MTLKFEDICKDFFKAYYGPAAEYVEEYFWSAFEQSQYIYKTSNKYHQDTYYSLGRDTFWKQTTLKNYASILNAAMLEIENSNCSGEQKEIYKERVFREYVLVRYNEYRLYPSYLSQSEKAELDEMVKIAQEVYRIFPA